MGRKDLTQRRANIVAGAVANHPAFVYGGKKRLSNKDIKKIVSKRNKERKQANQEKRT